MEIDLNNPEHLDAFMISVVSAVHSFEDKLNVKRGTLNSLFNEDDWSAVIKCQALVEASVTLLLSVNLDERLYPVFARLELAKLECGKLAFAKALDLMTSHERSFVVTLSELRNYLAHDPSYIGFTFEQYIGQMDKNQRKAFFGKLTALSPIDVKARDMELARENTKVMMVWAVLNFIIAVNVRSIGKDPEHQKKVFALSMEYLNILRNPDTAKALPTVSGK